MPLSKLKLASCTVRHFKQGFRISTCNTGD